MTTKTKIILGVAGGVAIGIVAGLLLAPEKGSDTISKVKDTAGGWVDSLSDLFSKAKDQAGRSASNASRKASDLSESYL